LWQLDRETFNAIVKDAAARKREKYEDLMKSVKLLSGMDMYERNKIADALKEEKHSKGETILKQGDSGDIFYFINEGECVATKTLEPGQPAKEVMKYQRGDYFGERGLLKNVPRAANVIAVSEQVSVVCLDRNTFKRLLGPLEEILKRNMEIYNEYC
jgi:cAMP-dependent protein kinase regulator